MPIASEKRDSRMSIEPSSFDAASASQVRLKDAYLGGLMEKQREDPSHQEEEEDSEDSDNPAAETWHYKEESVVQNSKAWGQSLADRTSSSVDQEILKNTEATWAPPPKIAGHIELFGSRLLHGQENLWKTTWRSYGRVECEFGYLVNVHEYHSSSSMTRIYITRRTISVTLWDNYFVK